MGEKIFKYLFFAGLILSLISIIFPTNANINKRYNMDNILSNEFVSVDDTTQGDTAKKVDLTFPIPKKNINPTKNLDNSPLYGSDLEQTKTEIVYDPETDSYIFKKTINDEVIETPFAVTFDEYIDYDFEKAMQNYWQQRANSEVSETRETLIPKLEVGGVIFDRIFGSNTVDIRPQGSVEASLGLNISKNENPSLPVENQRTTTFDFNEKIQMNVIGQIGDKLRVDMRLDTESVFEFEDAVKLEYTGHEDEIIQKIEAGNVSLPLTGTLISGSQSLFGFKTELKFGKLSVTSIFSQQRSESSVIEVEGGAQSKDFEVDADEYEADKHYFLSHYFKENYDRSLSALPIISSGINITRIEVWITNRTNDYDNSRNIVAFADLGESNTNDIQSQYVSNNHGTYYVTNYPDNSANILNDMSTNYPNVRDINLVGSTLLGLNMNGGTDYEKIESARLLGSNEYSVNAQLGYISLNSTLNSDQVLAVAYEYTVGGQVYKVGEFSNSAITAPSALVLKLIKGTSFTPRTKSWDLMMKNIYNIGAYQLSREDFWLDIMYNNDKTGTEINFLPAGNINDEQLISVMELDNLNSQLDPYPDGVFDFIEGITVSTSDGRIIFPVREPFGSHLKQRITNGDFLLDEIAEPFVFQELYDSTQSTARQIAEKNKFKLKGRYKSSGGGEIVLNAINIPQGSVSVTSGAQKLVENVDFTVDYNLGRLTIINQGLLESGAPIKVALESNSVSSMQRKSLLGTHLNYDFSKNFNVGATILHLSEKPITQNISVGNEPISNTIWGVNTSYRTDVPALTKAIDFIPFIETKEMSTITMTGEFAHLIPGHSKAIEGNAYIDDFEGAKTTIDLKSQIAWSLAGTPKDSIMFPEGLLLNELENSNRRAKLAWYVIDPLFQRSSSPVSVEDRSSHYVREIYEKELFPNKDNTTSIPTNMAALNLAFYPTERGPYNYDANNIDVDGNLLNPQTRWGGIMRQLQTTDFEESNIEYIEFWLMDPFVEDSINDGGDLYFNLGEISEDVLKDGRKSFEQGLPTPFNDHPVDTTIWGLIPLMQSLVNAFDIEPESRVAQDVGLDGLNDENERTHFDGETEAGGANFLNLIASRFGTESQAYQKAFDDPSSDNFHYFRGTDYDEQDLNILDRYKRFNGLEGNSIPTEFSPEDYPTHSSVSPNIEDINRDNTLNENEHYFQYRISIRKEDFEIGKNYITDIVEATATFSNDEDSNVKWYQFKIPVNSYDKKIGNISDFKSIRFIRMFMHNFYDETILRFATMSLVRGEWRKYSYSFMQPGDYVVDELAETPFDVSTVNIEENSSKTPVNYILPPGVDRQQSPTNTQLQLLNEQSMLLKVIDLQDGDARAVYKNINLDVRKYLNLKMFIHAESVPGELELNDQDLSVFIRLGTDYKNNYYEYEIPLNVTPAGNYDGNESTDAPDRYIVWPEENELNLEFELLQLVKQERNDLIRTGDPNVSLTRLYSLMDEGRKVSVMGNPNLSNVQTIMIGIRNPKKSSNSSSDDGEIKSGEIWVNELRLTNFDEEGGWAANARLTAKLADFGSVTFAGSTSKPGFGSIEQTLGERQTEEINQFDISSNLELGKFFPEKLNIRIPLYVGYSQNVKNPEYNPLDPDIPFDVTLDDPTIPEDYKDSLRHIAQDYSTRKSFNLTNVKVNKVSGTPKIYDLSNLSLSYGYSELFARDVNTIFNTNRTYTGMLSYDYNATPKIVEPFKNVKALNKRAFRIIKDINFYYLPSQLSFRSNINRQYSETQLRNIYNPEYPLPISVNKDFTWVRQYDFRYNLSKGLKLTFSATNNARIDEPQGRLFEDDPFYEQKQDTIWNNFSNFGRNTQYHHDWNVTYTVPLNKIPILNWISSNVGYSGTYDWTASPITADTINLGNTLQNGNTMSANVNINLLSLYNKIKYLEAVNKKYRGRSSIRKPKVQKETVNFVLKKEDLAANKTIRITHKLRTEDISIIAKGPDGKNIKGETRVINENQVSFKSLEDAEGATITVTGKRDKKESIAKKIVDNALVMIMSVKSISISLAETNGTLLPGYMGNTYMLGMSQYTADPQMFGPQPSIMTPTFPFVLGWQEDDFGRWAIENNLVTKDTMNVQPFMQTHSRNWTARASLEPVRNLRIDLTLNHSHSQNTSKYYRFGYNEDTGIDEFMELNQATSGTFNMSIISWSSAFESINSSGDYSSATFQEFDDNRKIIATRLASRHLGYDPNDVDADGFPSGYGKTSQDVLLSAFLAAYTGKDPNTVDLEPFPSVLSALPNWKITYDGLGKIAQLKKYFSSVNLNHSYRSTYSIGTYQSRLSNEFQGNADGLNTIRDELENYYSRYQINGVNISEQFSPLFSIDVTMVNSLIAKVEVKKNRTLSMSFTNNQLTEMKNDEFIIGTGYRFKDIEFVVKAGGRQRNLKSDLNVRIDFSSRNNLTIIRKLEEGFNQPTAGQRTYTIKTSADYVLSDRLNIRIFYDQVINKPTLNIQFPTTNTNFGVSLRFTLAS